jgi:hypothetical protein
MDCIDEAEILSSVITLKIIQSVCNRLGTETCCATTETLTENAKMLLSDIATYSTSKGFTLNEAAMWSTFKTMDSLEITEYRRLIRGTLEELCDSCHINRNRNR